MTKKHVYVVMYRNIDSNYFHNNSYGLCESEEQAHKLLWKFIWENGRRCDHRQDISIMFNDKTNYETIDCSMSFEDFILDKDMSMRKSRIRGCMVNETLNWVATQELMDDI
jgi:hypothetical protein